jgi:Domain of unknown function (DUF4266)
MARNRMQMKHLWLLVTAGGLAMICGCTSIGVRPWERDLLSRDEMQLNGNAVDMAIDDHLYFSKEASSGGRSYAGGGCGCN